MPSQLIFRAQLVFEEQRRIYDYWCRKAAHRAMPGRNDLDINEFPELAPSISLLKIQEQLLYSEFYSAGTLSTQMYNRELKGGRLGECIEQDSRAYWKRVYQGITQEHKARVGVIKDKRASEGGYIQFWLRLPLSDNGSTVTDILCHDMPYPVVRAGRDYPREEYESQTMAL